MTRSLQDLIEAGARAYGDKLVGMCSETKACPRCLGRGYHHGFGEYGADPDWCEACGGPGHVMLHDYETCEKAAWEAALTAINLPAYLELAEAAEAARALLAQYVELHMAKTPPDRVKAARNREMAERLQAALARIDGGGRG
jgi:hypothetical protein